VSLVGNLAQFSLADLLQVLAGSSHTGKLTLARLDKQGLIVLRNGKVIYAASTAVRDTLGSILVGRGQITEENLGAALERKHRGDRELRLGNVLVEMGSISAEQLEEAVRWQVSKVLGEFLLWKEAYFRFEPLEIPDHGEIAVDIEDLVSDDGFHPGRLMFGIMEHQDPGARERIVADMEQAARSNRKRLTTLEVIMTELHAPALTGELVAKVQELGAGIVGRGVLFAARNRIFSPRGHFGIEDPSGLGDLLLPMYEPSVVGLVAQRLESYRGPLFFSVLNQRLIEALGGGVPVEVLAIPLGVGRHVEAVFYGQAAQGEAIGPSDELELLFLRAGLEMEEAMLAKRKAYLDRVAPASEIPAV
jgi:hypothetical protein